MIETFFIFYIPFKNIVPNTYDVAYYTVNIILLSKINY